MYIHIYIYIYIHTHAYTDRYACACIYIYIHTHTPATSFRYVTVNCEMHSCSGIRGPWYKRGRAATLAAWSTNTASAKFVVRGFRVKGLGFRVQARGFRAYATLQLRLLLPMSPMYCAFSWGGLLSIINRDSWAR